MKLESLLDIDLLNRHLENKMIGVQRHPTLPLRIFNYTNLAQFTPCWNDGTIDFCRGLIVDDRNEIISRPFRKFHNLQTSNMPETWEENLPKTLPEITRKYDGSLAVYWYYDHHEGIATRGSFTSPQAIWATEWYNKKNLEIRPGSQDHYPMEWPIGTTPLFEIIYPENRIVVDYDFSGLVLPGFVDNEMGFEWDYESVKRHADYEGIRMTEKLDISLEQSKNTNIENEEGYVLTWLRQDTYPLKVKVKMADYVRLHKMITGMNARSVWEYVSSGKGLQDFKNTPEHFRKWLGQWEFKLYQEHKEILEKVLDIYKNRPFYNGLDHKYRAEYASYVKQVADKSIQNILFSMLDGKDINPLIWKSIKPRGDDQTFRTDGE